MGDAREGQLLNCHLYNDKELWEEADLDWYDYGFRNYDPQIGRFPQLDPLTWEYPELTNYQYASLDPIANVDLDGLEARNVVNGWVNGSYLNNIPGVANAVPSLNLAKLGINAAVNTAQFLIVRSEQSSVTNNLQKSLTALNINQSPPTGRRLEKLREEAVEMEEDKLRIDRMVEEGKWDRSLSPEEASRNLINNTIGLALPSVLKRPLTLQTRANGVSKRVNLGKKYISNPAAKTGVQATERVIKGFTGHATNQAITRGFKTADILKIVREGTPVERMGRYGSQIRYTLGGNTVVVNAQGKVVTLFSNAPGTAKGLGKGFFIPFK